MVYTHTISKAHPKPQQKGLRKLHNKRRQRVTVVSKKPPQVSASDLFCDSVQCKCKSAAPAPGQRHFDDLVMEAQSGQEVRNAFAALPAGVNVRSELARAIDARYKRLENEMGFATTGLRRMVCLGALCMSVIGLTLAVSGLHLGALSLACGGSVLAVFIVLAVLNYCLRCFMHRHTKTGRADLAQHREVLRELRKLCDQEKIMPDASSRVLLDRCKSVINGNIGFVTLEVLRGTILEPLVSACSMSKRRWVAWRLQRDAAILARAVAPVAAG